MSISFSIPLYFPVEVSVGGTTTNHAPFSTRYCSMLSYCLVDLLPAGLGGGRGFGLPPGRSTTGLGFSWRVHSWFSSVGSMHTYVSLHIHSRACDDVIAIEISKQAESPMCTKHRTREFNIGYLEVRLAENGSAQNSLGKIYLNGTVLDTRGSRMWSYTIFLCRHHDKMMLSRALVHSTDMGYQYMRCWPSPRFACVTGPSITARSLGWTQIRPSSQSESYFSLFGNILPRTWGLIFWWKPWGVWL